MRLTDSHTHLFMEPLGGSVETVLGRAADAGVQRVVVPAFDHASWEKMGRLCGSPVVQCALGLHPWVAGEGLDPEVLAGALQDLGAVAVGEIGLDSKIDVPAKVQERVFIEQLGLARDCGLPVILHCRGAFDRLISIMTGFDGCLRGVFHAFSRGPELAAKLLELGLHLGVGGAATRPRAKRIRRSLPAIPRDRLLLETDSPSMGLEGVSAGDSEPAHAREVCLAAAGILEMDPEELAEITWTNADVLFGLA